VSRSTFRLFSLVYFSAFLLFAFGSREPRRITTGRARLDESQQGSICNKSICNLGFRARESRRTTTGFLRSLLSLSFYVSTVLLFHFSRFALYFSICLLFYFSTFLLAAFRVLLFYFSRFAFDLSTFLLFYFSRKVEGLRKV
jgi:hypothetical protein